VYVCVCVCQISMMKIYMNEGVLICEGCRDLMNSYYDSLSNS